MEGPVKQLRWLLGNDQRRSVEQRRSPLALKILLTEDVERQLKGLRPRLDAAVELGVFDFGEDGGKCGPWH